MKRTIAFLVIATGCAAALLACEDKVVTSKATTPPPPVRTAVVPDAGLVPTKVLEFSENDFVESDHDRDHNDRHHHPGHSLSRGA